MFKNKLISGVKKDKPDDTFAINQADNTMLDNNSMVMMNNGVGICAEACACCWDTPLPTTYDDKATYIGKRTKIGHTSVIEHSNVVFLLELNLDTELGDLAEFLSWVNYLHVCYKKSKKNSSLGYLLIGGTWRGFADLCTVCPDFTNRIMTRVVSLIGKYIPSAAMKNIGLLNTVEDFRFDDAKIDAIAAPMNIYHNSHYRIDDNLDIVNCDDIEVLKQNIVEYCAEPELFNTYDLLPFVTLTVRFEHMSRIITQQLTRHRNGITQESQRYVNYSGSMFNSPAKFKDKYDSNHRYQIKFGSTTMSLTLQQLGDMMCSVYGQLTDKTNPRTKDYALQYEDARAYLPNNTQCGVIYITFTWKSFFKFLELREDSHAQAEIRQYALTLGKWFREKFPMYADFTDALIPVYDNKSHYMLPIVQYETDDSAEIFEEYIDAMENHVENFDENKLDPEEVEVEETKLRPGEI